MRLAALCLVVAGCGAAVDRPLSVPLGTSRASLPAELRRDDYCPQAAAEGGGERETFRRCDRPGAEWAESWIEADFVEDRLVRLRRLERFSDQGKAQERFSQLVGDRSQAQGGPSEAAKQQVLATSELPAGTKTWTAFAVDHGVVAVYLLRPSPPDNVSVIEEVRGAEH